MKTQTFEPFDLARSLEHIRHWLPCQSPIKGFVHHNTLHAFQDLPFDTAVLKARDLFGANAYLPLDEYRQYLSDGQVQEHELFQEARRVIGDELSRQSFCDGAFTGESFMQFALFEYQEYSDAYVGTAELEKSGISGREVESIANVVGPSLAEKNGLYRWPRAKLIRESHIDIDRTVNPLLFRLIASYLDQGICLWRFPNTHLNFFDAVKNLIQRSYFPLAPFIRKRELASLLALDSEAAILALLDLLAPDPSLKFDYLRESLCSHPGWSGMVATIEADPTALNEQRPIRLLDFVAVSLLLEAQAIAHGGRITQHSFARVNNGQGSHEFQESTRPRDRREFAVAALLAKLGMKGRQLQSMTLTPQDPLTLLLDFVSKDQLAAIWHNALEHTVQLSAIAALRANATRHLAAKDLEAQDLITALFCIDDRECSLRRYIEAEDDQVATASTAGFFGLDILFQSLKDPHPIKHCPVPVTPRHIVTEHRRVKGSLSKDNKAVSKTLGGVRVALKELSHSIILGSITTSLSAPWVLFKLLMRILWPAFLARFYHRAPVQEDTDIDFIRAADAVPTAVPGYGYTFEEMADRVLNVLESTGLIKTLSPLVVMVAHGSSSVNNPHFSAYDCGACSGRPGAPNAKTFALMANHKDVRKLLSARGTPIPENTTFVGAFHDTCKDTMLFFDVQRLSAFHNDLLKRFEKATTAALSKNAKERSRRMESIPLKASVPSAHKEVQHRAFALFEPRPEYNHATNAFCIVGRRYITKDLFLDRRAFLQSYDPNLDATGKLLGGIMSAVVPVCAGINLEYLFSRIDNEVYGSGSKLSHNVAALIGVMNGVDDDLRTGLPRQMIEIHDPLRCLFVIEHKKETISAILAANPPLASWFDLGWAALVALDPDDLSCHRYLGPEGFKALSIDDLRVPMIAHIEDYVRSSRAALKFGLILPPEKHPNLRHEGSL